MDGSVHVILVLMSDEPSHPGAQRRGTFQLVITPFIGGEKFTPSEMPLIFGHL